MTTRPRARRTRLKLAEEPGTGPALVVAPQRGDMALAPARGATRPAPNPAAGTVTGPAAGPAAGPSPNTLRQTQPQAPAQGPARPLAQPAPRTPPQPAFPHPATPAPASARPAAAPQPAPQPAAPQTPPPQPAQPQPTPAQSAPSAPRAAANDSAPAGDPASAAEAEIAAIRSEQLTGRQLRMAQRIAQKNGIRASSGLEAVRLLRRQGIDPFRTETILDLASTEAAPGQAADPAAAADGTGTSRALTTAAPPPLPRTRPDAAAPASAPKPPPAEARAAEIRGIQRDIMRRRRRRLTLLLARLLVFVGLPTLIVGYYFYAIATPLYATNSEFVIQQADAAAAPGAAGLGSMFSGTGLATQQDSVTVQSFLQSREAMRRLDAEHGFKAHFQDPGIDPLRRLAPEASAEAAYRLYQRMVQISYDPTEGIIRMEVVAADPETSERFARALVAFAEEQVDQLTQRLRENQMRDAMEAVEIAEQRNREAQMRVLELQEQFQVLSGEVEVSLLTQQITTLEGQLNQERLSLADLRANPRPQAARVAQSERRIAQLEGQIRALRASLTQGTEGSQSIARAQRELVMAEADVVTRQMLLQQAMTQLETARLEANRQVRFLSMGVSPIAPDEPGYPRAFANTALAFLGFSGLYLLMAMTGSILREQVTS